MRTGPVAMATLATALSLALAGCGAKASADPAAVIRSACVRCHTLDRIRQAQHDQPGWKATVDRMRGRGARVDDAQRDAVVDFLAGGGGKQL